MAQNHLKCVTSVNS